MGAPTSSEARTDFDNIVDANGFSIRFKYFSSSGADSGYDDEVVVAPSGVAVWVSGVTQPVSGKFGSEEASYLEQGIITHADTKLYIPGDHVTSGLWSVMLGSPTGQEFRLINDGGIGVMPWNLNGTTVYKKCYVRYLTNGSFVSE